MTSQRDIVQASLDRPDYADRCAVPRRPMTAREAAHAFVNAATHALPAPMHTSTITTFSVNRRS